MNFKTIHSAGSLGISDSIPDGAGMRISRDFGTELAKHFLRYSKSMFELTGDLPYIYRERQLAPAITLALAKFSGDSVFSELPTRRRVGREHSHGWIDFWATYRRTTFVLELKHGYSAFRGKAGAQADLVKKWSDAESQVRSVSKERYEEMRFDSGEVVTTPLLVVTHYSASRAGHDPQSFPSKEQMVDRHAGISNSLNPVSNCSFLLYPKGYMMGPIEYEQHSEIYPAVSLFMNFSAISGAEPG